MDAPDFKSMSRKKRDDIFSLLDEFIKDIETVNYKQGDTMKLCKDCENQLNKDLSKYPFNKRALWLLHVNYIRTVDHLIEVIHNEPQRIIKIPGLGQKTYDHIIQVYNQVLKEIT